MKRVVIAIAVCLASAFSIAGQVLQDLTKVTTERVVYVRDDVELIPSVDAQGRLCQIVLQPNHYSNRTILVGKQVVTGEEIEGILDLLVPMKERGKKEKGWGDTALMGQMYATHYPFERVEVVLSGALNFEPSSDSPSKPSPDDIAKGKLGFSSAQVATISWPDRKCVQ